MREDKSLLMPSATKFGLYMGLFWLFKYSFFILSVNHTAFGMIYWSLTFLVPYLAYVFTKRYRDSIGGFISLHHAWQFGLLTYTCAGLIVALGHFVFYRFLAPPDLISNTLIEATKALSGTQLEEGAKMLSETTITPIQMTLQQFMNNIFYGIILSIPVAAMVKKGKREECTKKQ